MSSGSLTTGLGATTITGIENLKGSQFRDYIVGDSTDNSLDGYSGDDIIEGGAGKDYLLGGDGNDTLRGDSGVDIYEGGNGEDILDFYSATGRVVVDLTAVNIVTDDGYGNTETAVTGIENIGGTSTYNDTLTGDNNANKIYGYGGHDSLYGLDGIDTIFGATGNDNIYTGAGIGDVALGESGTDTLYGNFDGDFLWGGNTVEDVETDWINFATTTAGVILDLGTTVTVGTGIYSGLYSKALIVDATPLDNTDNTQFDYIRQIENIIGSSGDDTLSGNASQNSISSGDGDDIIFYTRGNDYYNGGNHTTSTGQGSGTPTLGNGDWISLEKESTTTVVVRLDNGIVGDTTNNGSTGVANILNVENVIGYNGLQNSTAWGTTGNNIFVMYGGADDVVGLQGDNIYDLGAQNDAAYASNGNDTIIGGLGNDRLDYYNWSGSGTQQSTIIILTSQDFNNNGNTTDANESVTIQSITVQGLGTLADGSYNFFRIRDGRTGTFDYLYQETSADALANGVVAGTSDFEYFYLSNFNSDLGDIFSGDADANSVWGFNGNDTIYTQGGDDYINGGNGNDIINGGSGKDRVAYDTDAQVNLSDTTQGGIAASTAIGEGTDTLVGIEDVQGGAGTDRIYGSDSVNTIWGGEANDTLYGLGGNDFLYGGNGLDSLYGGIGNDSLWGENGNDTIYGGADNDRIDGGNDNDTMYGEAGVDLLYGQAGDDTLDGGTENDTLWGGLGNDLLILDFSGVDKIYGEGGTDTVSFTGTTSTISADTNFAPSATTINTVEKFDLSSLSLNSSSDSTEFIFTDALLTTWTGSSTGSFTLSFTSSQREKIMFTDSGGTVRDTAAEISDGATYTVGSHSLTIDITDI
jgi:Ca2+-binding RTX toxin-like protein